MDVSATKMPKVDVSAKTINLGFRILTVDLKMHDNKSMLFFIETGKLWCILYCSK